jgi:hypothetical protein
VIVKNPRKVRVFPKILSRIWKFAGSKLGVWARETPTFLP